MKTQNIKLGTIVQILGGSPNFFGVITNYGEFETQLNNIVSIGIEGYQVYCGPQGYRYLVEESLQVINTNYAIDGNFISGFGVIYEEFEAVFNKAQDSLTKSLESYKRQLNDSLFKTIKAVKPKEDKKEFNFNSNYTPVGLRIVVGKKFNESPYLSINGSKLTETEINYLDVIANGTVATMKIAATTVMIGTVIGDTATIRAAVQYYYSLIKK